MAKEKEVNEKTAPSGESVDTVTKAEYDALLERITALEKEKSEAKENIGEKPSQLSIERQKALDELNARVKIKLFKDGDKYKDDVFVSINGKAIQIKRGIDVEIPKCYADVIDQSLIQSIKAAELMDKESKEFEQSL